MNGRNCSNIKWRFDFGKYKGQTVEDVIEDDPDYLYWCEEEGIMYFHGEVMEALEPTPEGEAFSVVRAHYFPNASNAVH